MQGPESNFGARTTRLILYGCIYKFLLSGCVLHRVLESGIFSNKLTRDEPSLYFTTYAEIILVSCKYDIVRGLNYNESGGNGQATYASIIPLSKSTNALESETRSLNYSYYVLDHLLQLLVLRTYSRYSACRCRVLSRSYDGIVPKGRYHIGLLLYWACCTRCHVRRRHGVWLRSLRTRQSSAAC